MQLVPCTWLALQSLARPSATRVLRPEYGRVRRRCAHSGRCKGLEMPGNIARERYINLQALDNTGIIPHELPSQPSRPVSPWPAISPV